MRGLVDGLPTPRPIGAELPAAFQEDEFCQRMMTAFDDELAPVFTTLDCLDSYLDPQLAPPDFVDWLASWVGVEIDETWTLERRRRLIRDAVVLYRIRGTAAGLAAHISLYAGVAPEIEDSGGCEWSQTAGSPMPGSSRPHLTVRLRVDDAGDIRRSTVSRIVGSSRPAHVPYHLEILAGGTTVESTDETEPAPAADKAAPGAVDLPGSERIELAPQGPANQEELDAATESTADDTEPTT
jgi:phage tail-like protein